MKKIVLLLIIFLAAFLRFYHFTTNPPGLYWDEVAIGYNAYSILETGKDEWGTSFPLLFRSFNDYKLPGYIYTTVISEKIFGVNEAGVRIPSVIAGILSVIAVYFIVKNLLKNNRVALVASLLLAISPWHLQFSRAGFEANLSLMFILAGLMFFLRWRLFLSVTFFVLSMYTYHNARVFVPIFGLVLLFLYRDKLLLSFKKTLLVAGFAILILIPLGTVSFSKEAYARLDTQSILHQKGGVFNLSDNYLAMFNTDFLFFKGDQAGRHSVKKIGELYLWQLPFVALGVFILIKKKNSISIIILSWLAIGAIPPAITSISPHALRGLIDVPVYQILTAIGLVFIWKRFAVVISFICVYAFLVYLHLYYVHYPTAYSMDWEYGSKEAVQFVQKIESNYKDVYFYQELPYIHFLFYSKFDPMIFQTSNHDTTNIGKYHWLRSATFPDHGLVVAPAYLISADNEKIIREIRLLNKDPMFRIYEM